MPGFQLKNFVSIAAAMINHAKATQNKLTDFEVGSVARTMLEAPAIEIEELYQKIFSGILDAIPTSIYKSFGFELIEEAAARGNVTIHFAGPIVEPFTIPAGTLFDAPSVSLKFTSAEGVQVPAGATSATVIVVCATPGAIGNVDAGAITSAVNIVLPAGSTIANAAITSGRDAQTEAERQARFQEFILSLSRGTEGAIRYAVRQAQIKSDSGLLLEYVSRVGMVEQGGLVDVYIYGSAGVPSAALIAESQKIIDGHRTPGTGVYEPGYRAIGVSVHVKPMTERAVPVTLHVQPLYGVDPSDAIKNQVATLLAVEFDAVQSGDVLLVDQLVGAALTVPGVQKVVPANDANMPCAAHEVLKLGAFHVEWMPNA